MYDVIVIGAGPSGCIAAKMLASGGYNVLLVEKLKLPRYKSCSGVLIKKSLDLVNKYFYEDVPDFVTCTPSENRGMVFTDDKGVVYTFEQPGLNVWRSSFDKWLSDKAVLSGAKLKDNTMALSVTEDEDAVSVTLKGENKYAEKARYVIDCEGVTGCIKNALTGFKGNDSASKTEQKNQYITTFQTYNKGSIDLDYHYFYAYLQPELSEYDAWFNVKDNQLVLGVAVKDAAKVDFYYPRLIEYMKQNHNLRITEQVKTDKWIMPRITPDFTIHHGKGRVLFAGEAAGFLNPMGEGISAGMESGFLAASAVMENFDNAENALEKYMSSTSPLHDYMKRQWRLVGDLTGTFSFIL